ncbi:MAG: hypothetical protein ABI416_15995 [Ginsengibacter sp.]
MKSFRITKNPFLLFAPFLLFYTVFILILYSAPLWGDEIRHFAYAENLLRGFYSPVAPNVSLEVGPGYPILIWLFLILHMPLIFLNLINGVFNYLAIVYLFKSLQQILSFKRALIFSLFLACYSNSLEFMPLKYSESLTLFLVSMTLYYTMKAFSPDNLKKHKKYIYLAGFVIGYLALTKIIFGYVLILLLAGSGFLWLIKRKNNNYRKAVFILLVAFATTAPYLAYTYHLTGKIFYWGTSGGNNLYWMSTPYEGEYGSWYATPRLVDSIPAEVRIRNAQGGQLNLKNRYSYLTGSDDSIKVNHKAAFEELNKYHGVEKDDLYRKLAIINIKSHPAKYIKNCISNIGRILFNYPYTYAIQKPETLLRLPLNGIIIVCMLFCLVPTLLNWRKIIFPIRFILFFTLLYLGGSVFGSAETRMFTVIVPILLLWIAYIMQKSIQIKLKFDEDSDE